MIKPCFCTLCGEELTAPQFYNGKPYGWSCIKKVNPNHKKDVWYQVKVTDIREAGRINKRIEATYKQGKCNYTLIGQVDESGNFWVSQGFIKIFNKQLPIRKRLDINKIKEIEK